MCTMSMVMDHYGDEWRRRYIPSQPQIVPFIPPPVPSTQELDEFRRLLDRAREYDKKHNEPDCELDSKKQILKDLAAKLGVDISFIDAPASA